MNEALAVCHLTIPAGNKEILGGFFNSEPETMINTTLKTQHNFFFAIEMEIMMIVVVSRGEFEYILRAPLLSSKIPFEPRE